ncbi:hypothetical protein KUCAC02_004860, partial [Chaenocephalus aceratus]
YVASRLILTELENSPHHHRHPLRDPRKIPCRRSDCPRLPAVAMPAERFIDTKLPPQGGVNTNDKDVSFPLCQPE